ncbi:MAG TPA: type II toxin-antitoxin system PemK/MazF family toxin [Solirubrobacteraceae bacterium]|nr:type II toxin-antitoxin system PemK/MazF family toxin [Solirubrobacteraceae bacterium]
MASTEPRRGEVWLVSLGAARPGEPGKNRPAVVISADRLSARLPHDLIVVVPLSSSLSPSGLRPEVITGEGVLRPSRAVCGAIRGIARSRLLRRLGELPPVKLAAIDHALMVVLNLPGPRSPARSEA